MIWNSHTDSLCEASRQESISRGEQDTPSCPHHPFPQGTPLLLGSICVLCSPHKFIRSIEPSVLRNLKDLQETKPESLLICYIDNSSAICNLTDPVNCRKSNCVCSKHSIIDASQRELCRVFWLERETLFNPHNAQEPTSEDENMDANVQIEDDDTQNSQIISELSDFNTDGLVKECTMRNGDLFAFAIKDPPPTVKPQTLLSQYVDEILEAIRSSYLLRNRENDSFKLWIWGHSHFVKVANDTLDPSNLLYNIKKHNTFNFAVPGFNGGLQKCTLQGAIADLHDKFENVKSEMESSGWGFQRVTDIKICMCHIEHRLIEKSRVLPSGRIIKKFIKYPLNNRGGGALINFNYDNPTFRKMRDPTKAIWQGWSPCVMYALKIYKISQDNQLPLKDEIIQNLLTYQVHHKYTEEAKEAICNTTVKFPPSLDNEGLELKDFTALERVNNIPIAVYYVNDKVPSDKMGDVTLTNLRAPKPSIIRECGGLDKMCCLGLISSDHVVLIHDIFEYMQRTLNRTIGRAPPGRPLKERRCPFCFGLLHSREMLEYHIESQTCTSGRGQPPRIVMAKQGEVISHEIDGCTEKPLLTVVIDTESRLLPPDDVPSEDFVFDTDIGDDGTVTRKDNILHYHVPQSVGMLFIDNRNKVLGYHAIIDDDSQYTFPQYLTDKITHYSEKLNAELCSKAYMTDADEQNFRNATRCGRCSKKFVYSKKKKFYSKHRHHSHHIHPVYDSTNNKKLIRGNYVEALCNFCNWKVTSKRKMASCVMHNASNYDLPMLMKGLTSDTERIRHITVLPKGVSGYVNVKYRNASFIDSCSFIKASLSELVDLKCKNVAPQDLHKTIPITVSIVGERFGREVTKFLGRKQIYPYTLPKNKKDLESILEYPKKEDFFNHLTDKHISEEDYQFGQIVWDTLKEKFGGEMSLKILHEYYLCSDVCLLADVWCWYADLIATDFKMDVASCLTGPQLVYQIAKYMGGTDLELLSNYGMYLDFEQNIHGGLVTLTKRHVVCNMVENGIKYVKSRLDQTLLYGDWNGMYAGLLKGSLPYGNFEYLKDISQFKNVNFLASIDTSDNEHVDYYLIVDIEIPERIKEIFDDFPLIVVNCNVIKPSEHTASIGTKIDHSKSSKLICGHFDMKFHGVDLALLQFYMKMGVRVTNVHRVILYSKKPIFKAFIDHCTEQRIRNLDNAVLNAIYKLLSNSLYGRCIMDQRKYNLISRLVDESQIKFEVSHPKFHTIRKISKKCFLITRSKEAIVLRSPIYIGCILLQKAKLMNLKFHYTVAKPSAYDFPDDLIGLRDKQYEEIIDHSRKFIESIYLCYSDTDSLCYHVIFRQKGLSLDFVYKNTFLKAFLDRSNFKVLSRQCEFRGGEHGRMKLETSDNIPVEAFFISSKVYSIELQKRESSDPLAHVTNHDLSVREYKRAAKGCLRCRLASVLTHAVYKQVYEGTCACPPVKACSFRFNPRLSAMVTETSTKIPLSMREDKRFWLNKDESVAYGHKLSYAHGYRDNDIKCIRGGHIAGQKINEVDDTFQNDMELQNVLFDLMCMEGESELEYDSDGDIADETDDEGEARNAFGNNKRKFDNESLECSQTKQKLNKS